MNQATADKVLAEARAGYGKIGDETALTREAFYWDELTRFVDYVREGESVLDVGCGNGRAYDLFKPKNVSYAGIDVSPAMIENAKKFWQTPQTVFEVGDLLKLPVPENRYNVVIAAGVLQHVPSVAYRQQAMRELARATMPGGYILMADWNLWRPRYWKMHVHQMFGRKNGWDKGDLKLSWKTTGFPRYFHAFVKNELHTLATGAGLAVVEQYYVKKGDISTWLKAENLVTICRKPTPPASPPPLTGEDKKSPPL